MRRTALVLATALALGAGAGFFVHTGMAGDAELRGLRRRGSSRGGFAAASTASASGWSPRDALDTSEAVDTASALEVSDLRGIAARPRARVVADHWTSRRRRHDRSRRTSNDAYSAVLLPRAPQRGDRIQIVYLGRPYAYRVSRSRVISVKNLHMADAVGHERLVLTACTPRGSAQYRLVVEALPA